MVKTISDTELEMFLSFLPSYLDHLDRVGSQSLLCRFYGAFAVRGATFGATVTLLLFGNVLPALPSFPLDAIFDLKGSTVGRAAKGGPPSAGDATTSSTRGPSVQQDDEFRRQFPGGIRISAAAREDLLSRAALDVKLLQAHGVVDYSLLLGVAKKQPHNPQQLPQGRLPFCVDAWLPPDGTPVTLFAGIIDLLQPYNLSKQLERGVKMVRHMNRSVDVSSVDPAEYASRFMRCLGKSFTASSETS